MDAITTNTFIKEIIEEVDRNYADEISREKLEIGAINGILGVLDEHSVYISRDEFSSFARSTRGSFLGVGVEIRQVREGVEVAAVIDDSPASMAGLREADLIVKIDDRDVADMSMKEVISKLSSDSALKVKLSIIRSKSGKFDIILKKSVIQLQSVKVEFISDIAKLRITFFNEGTVAEATKAIRKIIKHKVVGVILDLRNNPGGIMEQAIKTSDLFLGKNKKIVEFKSRNKTDSRLIFSNENDLLHGLPMAVLMDSNTASGAELVAAALGHNKRAILIGETTYGKGSLQTVIPIPGRGAIKLTTAYFLSPTGQQINQNGVVPDIEVEREPKQASQEPDSSNENKQNEVDPMVQRAIDLLKALSALNNASEDSSNLNNIPATQ
ncbi:MAG: S41 family peptidase [Holosporales bacterium]|jgi:carboxyl-terminal processing protease|nr:S41 family peptidase [Holosporales bacterium]